MNEHATIGFYAANIARLAQGVLDAETLEGILRAAVQPTAVDLFDNPKYWPEFSANTVAFIDELKEGCR